VDLRTPRSTTTTWMMVTQRNLQKRRLSCSRGKPERESGSTAVDLPTITFMLHVSVFAVTFSDIVFACSLDFTGLLSGLQNEFLQIDVGKSSCQLFLPQCRTNLLRLRVLHSAIHVSLGSLHPEEGHWSGQRHAFRYPSDDYCWPLDLRLHLAGRLAHLGILDANLHDHTILWNLICDYLFAKWNPGQPSVLGRRHCSRLHQSYDAPWPCLVKRDWIDLIY